MTLRARHCWRIGLTVATALVLLVGATSCFEGLFVSHANAAGMVYAGSITRGALHVTGQDRGHMRVVPAPGWASSFERTFGPPRIEWMPDWYWSLPGMAQRNWSVRLPLWIVLALLGTPCAWLWGRHLTHPAHVCRACRYDLTGLKGGVCPECGQTTGA